VTPDIIADSTAEPLSPAPSTAGMTTRVVKGSLWTLAGQVAPLAVSLITTPFVIRMLGTESYGVLILVGLIPAYLGFGDFGMNLASTKFASEAYAQGDPVREARIVRTAALIASFSSAPLGIVLFAFSTRIISLFNVPDALRGEASLALKFAAITFVVNFLNSIINTPQLARLRMDVTTLIASGFRILGLVATPIILYMGEGVVGAVLVLMVSSLLTLTAHIYFSQLLLPDLLGWTIDRGAVRPLLKFGIALACAGIAGIFLINVEKAMIAWLISIAALAYYSVALTLANMLTMFSAAMIQSLLPAFSQLQGSNRRNQLVVLYSRGIRFNLIWLIPALVTICLIA
jgi:O-antigen/teichoic acid export membrane protein